MVRSHTEKLEQMTRDQDKWGVYTDNDLRTVEAQRSELYERFDRESGTTMSKLEEGVKDAIYLAMASGGALAVGIGLGFIPPTVFPDVVTHATQVVDGHMVNSVRSRMQIALAGASYGISVLTGIYAAKQYVKNMCSLRELIFYKKGKREGKQE